MTLATFLRRYTAELGWRLLPVERGDKLPLWKDWPTRATADPAEALSWLARYPHGVNLGMACGVGSGVFVLDVDRHDGAADGEAFLAELEQRHGALPAISEQRTGGGGRQLVFAYPVGRTIRNSAGKLAPGLDVRGEGGFAVLPPSLHPSGRRYAWREGRAPWECQIADAPAWFLDLLDPPRVPVKANPIHSVFRGRPVHRGGGVNLLAAEARELRATGEGARNYRLNLAAFRCGLAVARDRFNPDDVRAALTTAALASGLTPDETAATIESGLSAGVRVGEAGR